MSKPKVHGIGEHSLYSSRRWTLCEMYSIDTVTTTAVESLISCKKCLKTFDVTPVNPLPDIRLRLSTMNSNSFGRLPQLIKDAQTMLKMLEEM